MRLITPYNSHWNRVGAIVGLGGRCFAICGGNIVAIAEREKEREREHVDLVELGEITKNRWSGSWICHEAARRRSFLVCVLLLEMDDL